MRILALAPRPPWPEHDGGTVATVRCLRGLAAAGAEVTLLSMRTEKHHPRRDSSGEKPYRYLTDYREILINTRINPLSMALNFFFSGNPYDLARFRSNRFSEALFSLLRNTKFDIIHCEGLAFAQYLDEIRKFTTAPVVLRAHNLEHRIREMMAASEQSRVRKSYLSNLSQRLMKQEKKAALRFDAIVPISEPDTWWFSSAAPAKPVFMSVTGAYDIGYLPEPETGNPRVGFIGSMNWKPNEEGIRWFVESVWPSVLKKIPDATLHIAGKGLSRHDCFIPGGHNICNEGEPDDARHFMASNHVLISPLFSGSGIRIKIIDAMSTGRPVVATTVAVAGLKAVNGRDIAVADDANSFSDAVVKYLLDPALRSVTGKAASALVGTEYDNRTLTEQLYEFYKELTRGR